MEPPQENPAHEVDTPPPKKTYPIRVVYVYRPPTNFQDETLLTIRQTCAEKNIGFQVREYNSYKFNEDRDEIERVPALHLYEKGAWQQTFYPVGRPIQIIEESYAKFEKAEAAAGQAKETWRQRLAFWKERILAATRRKTRMEVYEAAQARKAAARPQQRSLEIVAEAPVEPARRPVLSS